jgi:hypothetical protein
LIVFLLLSKDETFTQKNLKDFRFFLVEIAIFKKIAKKATNFEKSYKKAKIAKKS